MYKLKLNGIDEKKGKGHDGLETLNIYDVSYDDKWITKDESSNHDTNDERMTHFYGSSSSSTQAHNGGRDVDFIERCYI